MTDMESRLTNLEKTVDAIAVRQKVNTALLVIGLAASILRLFFPGGFGAHSPAPANNNSVKIGVAEERPAEREYLTVSDMAKRLLRRLTERGFLRQIAAFSRQQRQTAAKAP